MTAIIIRCGETAMPMIDAYAVAGTFADKHQLAVDLATAVMTIEQVPDIPMFRKNTAAFVHELPADCLSNVDGDSNYVRVQVLTNSGALDRDKQLAVVRQLTGCRRFDGVEWAQMPDFVHCASVSRQRNRGASGSSLNRHQQVGRPKRKRGNHLPRSCGRPGAIEGPDPFTVLLCSPRPGWLGREGH